MDNSTLLDSLHTLQRCIQLHMDKYGYSFEVNTLAEGCGELIDVLLYTNLSTLDILKIQNDFKYIKDEFQKEVK
jgi:hypothetical protein